jgi:DNA polymerase I
MKFLNYIENAFERILVEDTEFRFDMTKTIPETVLCHVYTDVFTEETFRFWEDKNKSHQPHFDFENILIVSFNATAEIGCHLNLLHGRPNNVFDSYVENARLYKPMRVGKGALSLLTTAEHYGIKDKMSYEEKENNLDLILRRNNYAHLPFEYSKKEQKQILDYCEADTKVLREVFIRQVLDIEEKLQLKTNEDFAGELWRILNRGYAVGCVALVERNGIPVDVSLVNKFNNYWPAVKNNLIKEVNKEIDVFNEDLTFSFEKFNQLIKRNKLDHKWQRMKTGNFTTNKKVIKQHLDNEDIKKFDELRTLQNMTKLTAYTPGNDGRTRTSFNMFGTVTGRASPSSSKYVFSASKWARNFIKPSFGNYLVYIDYTSQEPGIMGYLSNDENLIKAYQSGDIYIHTAKLFGMVPDNATKQSHPEERNIFKVLYLANSYGQGPRAIAETLKISVSKAKELQNKYKEVYSKYFTWVDGIIEQGMQQGYLSTVLGWQRHIKNLFMIKDGKKVDIRRSLLNWPIQSHGAEILRTALIDLTDNDFKVVALVHDAVMLEIPIPEFKERLEEAKQIMVDASIKVVGGPIRVDQEIIKSNYEQEPKDQKLFEKIMDEIARYTRSEEKVHPDREYRPI